MPLLRTLLFALLALLGCARGAQACNIPVFRYALERWAPEPYEILVYHRGTLSAADKESIDKLERLSHHSNTQITVIDLTQPGQKMYHKLHATFKRPELPLLAVLYPWKSGRTEPIHIGPLRAEALQGLVDSPVRRTIAKRLLKGETAVFILLECGEKSRDDEKAALLQSELKKLEKTLKLPNLTDDPEDQLANKKVPLKLAFSVVRLARQNPAEQAFVRMLLLAEEDLLKLQGPMVFPVFGRGRALDALVDKGITAANLTEVGAYLCGPCTCKVKEQNPGVDLLFTAEWEQVQQDARVKDRELPPLIGLDGFKPAALPKSSESPISIATAPPVQQQAEPPSKTIEPAKQTTQAEPSPVGQPTAPVAVAAPAAEVGCHSCLLWNIGLAVGGGLLLLAAGAFYFMKS